MQMKKNYLLLFLMALLFGTANMRGQSLPWSQLIDDGNGFTVKIGNGYLLMTETEAKCVSDKSDLPRLSVSQQESPKINISLVTPSDEQGIPLAYSATGLKVAGINQTFVYAQEGGKYYIKTPDKGNKKGKYVTKKDGHFTLASAPSSDAVVEITRRTAGGGGNLDAKGLSLHHALALFQFLQSEEGGIKRTEGPFIGTGLGQYSKHFYDNETNWKAATDNQFRNANTPSYTEGLVRAREEAINGLKINIPTSSYFYVTTKSQFEDQVRANAKTPGYSNTPIESIPGLETSQPAQYLKATATGYVLTPNKNEAAVFYFDGHHLTGLDYGFGLSTTQYQYGLSEMAQKAVVGQGKLKKTLDAGSYSLKVGDKFVKLDSDNGLSLTDDESESHLFLEEATKFTLHTDALGYVSFFAPTAVEVPNNVKVYTGKLNAGNTQLTFTEVSNKQIPENTAVLLQMGTSKTQFEVKKIATASAIANNSLKGYTVSSADHKNNAYGLMAENGKLVFKPLSDGVRAFRAVIYQDNGAGTQEFILTSFAPTGIEGVTAKEKQEEVFDLAGRRVEFPVKGQVYVKGGKKFIQK